MQCAAARLAVSSVIKEKTQKPQKSKQHMSFATRTTAVAFACFFCAPRYRPPPGSPPPSASLSSSHRKGAAALTKGRERRGTTASTRWKSASLRPSSSTVSLSVVCGCVRGRWWFRMLGWIRKGIKNETAPPRPPPPLPRRLSPSPNAHHNTHNTPTNTIALTDQHRAHPKRLARHQVLERVLEEHNVVVRRRHLPPLLLAPVRPRGQRRQHLLKGLLHAADPDMKRWYE